MVEPWPLALEDSLFEGGWIRERPSKKKRREDSFRHWKPQAKEALDYTWQEVRNLSTVT